MKQLLLATALIALPVAGFTGFYRYFAPAVIQEASLGDMSPFKTIVSDVQKIVATGDMAGAQMRITDFESAWDDADAAMRPLNTDAWGTVDDAADAALGALRAGQPKADEVTATLAGLMAAIDNPYAGSDASPVAPTMISGISVTDESGRALPCETMLADLRATLPAASLSDADKAIADDLQAKATERCNADDDQHADAFSAQALAIVAK